MRSHVAALAAVLFCSSPGYCQGWFLGNSTPVTQTLTGGVAIDLDGNGRDELVVATQSVVFSPFHLTAYSFDAVGAASAVVTSAANTIADPFGQKRLQAGDVTGDGTADFLMPTFAGVTVVRGSGSGFGTSYVATTQPFDPSMGDLDNDGDLDLVTVASVNMGVDAFLNNGAGGFAPGVYSASGMGSGYLDTALGDFDADGRLDAVLRTVMLHSTSTVSGLRGTSIPGAFLPANGTPFVSVVVSSPGAGLAVADFDADGDDDIIHTTGGSLALVRSTTTALAASITVSDGTGSVVVANLDGDSALDVVCGYYGPSVAAVLDPGVTPSVRKLSTYKTPTQPVVGRFTSSSARDIVLADTLDHLFLHGTISCMRHEPAGPPPLAPPVAKYLLNPLGNVVATRPADFDGDGHPDLVVKAYGITSHLLVLRGDGVLGFTGGSASTPAGSGDDLEIGDLDGDGDLDVASPGGQQLAYAHLQTTPGNLAPPIALAGIAAGTKFVSRIELGDVDVDGKLDVMGGSDSGTSDQIRVAIAANPATLAFVEAPLISVDGGLAEFHAVDLDFDLDVDLVAARSVGGAWQLATASNTSGSYAPWSQVATLTTDSIVAGPLVDDFDGDGRADVVVRVHLPGQIGNVLYGSGVVGGFGPLVNVVADWYGDEIDAGDLDLDGRTDILIESADFGVQEVWERGTNGDFILNARHPGIAKLARLDDDSLPDRVTRISGLPELVLIRNESAGAVQSFGAPCALGGASPPTLGATNPAIAGSPFTLSINQGLGGATALVFFGLKTTAVPVGLGCSFYLTPILPTTIALVLSGSGIGQGNANLPTVLPPALAGFTFTTQCATIEAPSAYALSNALAISVK